MSESTCPLIEIPDFIFEGPALHAFHKPNSPSNPENILCLSIVDPLLSPSSNIDVFRVSPGADASTLIKPLSTQQLREVLRLLPHLEEIRWLSSLPPPQSFAELVSKFCPRLTTIVCEPQHLPVSTIRSSLPKWDAYSLSCLSGLCITSLRLFRLSQTGAQAFASLLKDLHDDSSLEELVLDFLWLDDHICTLIVQAGRKLRRLCIGTSGTKFTDKGLHSILEGCESLEHFALSEIQGRLSRKAWEKLCSVSSSLIAFEINVSESGPNHSWTMDHFSSIHAFPMSQLTSLSLLRKTRCPILATSGDNVLYAAPVDELMATVKHVPEEVVGALGTATELAHLKCDLWSFTLTDVRTISSSCAKLETALFCLEEPFAKLISSSINSSLTNLRELRISVLPDHVLGNSPTPLLPYFREPSLPTPIDSPSKASFPAASELLAKTSIPLDACAEDRSVPLLRDVKRFVRKFAKIEFLEWYGVNGRGNWTVSRPAKAKTNVSTMVEYHPPMLDVHTYEMVQCEYRLKTLEGCGIQLKNFECKRESDGVSPEPIKQRKVSVPAPLQLTEEVNGMEGTRPTPPTSETESSNELSGEVVEHPQHLEVTPSGPLRQRRYARSPSDPALRSNDPTKIRGRRRSKSNAVSTHTASQCSRGANEVAERSGPQKRGGRARGARRGRGGHFGTNSKSNVNKGTVGEETKKETEVGK